MTNAELDHRIELGVLRADLKIAASRAKESRQKAKRMSEIADIYAREYLEIQSHINDLEAKGAK